MQRYIFMNILSGVTLEPTVWTGAMLRGNNRPFVTECCALNSNKSEAFPYHAHICCCPVNTLIKH